MKRTLSFQTMYVAGVQAVSVAATSGHTRRSCFHRIAAVNVRRAYAVACTCPIVCVMQRARFLPRYTKALRKRQRPTFRKEMFNGRSCTTQYTSWTNFLGEAFEGNETPLSNLTPSQKITEIREEIRRLHCLTKYGLGGGGQLL